MKIISTLFYNNFFISLLAAQKAAWKAQEQSAQSNELSELQQKFINGGGSTLNTLRSHRLQSEGTTTSGTLKSRLFIKLSLQKEKTATAQTWNSAVQILLLWTWLLENTSVTLLSKDGNENLIALWQHFEWLCMTVHGTQKLVSSLSCSSLKGIH